MAEKLTYEELEQRVETLEIEIVEWEQKKAALRVSEEKYRDLYDSAPDMFVSVDAKTAKIFDCNQTLANALGYAKEEIIGRPIFDMYTPESAEHAKAKVFPVFAKTGTIEAEELQLQRKDGSKIDVSLNVSAVSDEQGGILYSRSVWRDITKRKEVEEALKKAHSNLERKVEERTAQLSKTVYKLSETELRYRTVADFTYDWEFWSNMDGTMQYVSPSCERISGYTPGQFIDNPALFREIIIPEDQDIWSKHYHDTRKEPKAREIQFRIRTRDGTVCWIEHACQPVTGDQGELLGFRASNRDITKRKEGEIKLQNAYSEIKMLKAQLEADRTYLREEIKLKHDHENIIGNSDVLKYVLFRAEQIAPTDTTVLILGETGTGKELIARAIHNAGKRKERPLIKVDCASLPANLIESELFGHEKGAFTDAVEKRIGRFELAHGATLFLDEIGELPLELQPKLLRVLQDGEFERLGSSQTLRTDVRVIAATNRNLEEDVRKKVFRMDLWYRLNVFAISIPPLRDRTEDIALLVNYMIKNFERKHGKQITSIPTNVLTKLQNYSWPGNVREMENLIERAVINTQGDTLQLEDALDAYLPADLGSPDLPIKSLAEIEQEHILRVLKNTNWKIHGENGAADLLDINPSTLRGRMRKHGIRRPPYKI
jgi:PAS domain S-box-containing protein